MHERHIEEAPLGIVFSEGPHRSRARSHGRRPRVRARRLRRRGPSHVYGDCAGTGPAGSRAHRHPPGRLFPLRRARRARPRRPVRPEAIRNLGVEGIVSWRNHLSGPASRQKASTSAGEAIFPLMTLPRLLPPKPAVDPRIAPPDDRLTADMAKYRRLFRITPMRLSNALAQAKVRRARLRRRDPVVLAWQSGRRADGTVKPSSRRRGSLRQPRLVRVPDRLLAS